MALSHNDGSDANMLSLHMDQQSLILGDLINVRNRLEEDNSELREKLYEAELTIQLLTFKLSKAKKAIKERAKASAFDARFNDDDQSSKYWNPIEKAANKWKKLKSRRKKDSFINTIVPGKKTFQVTPSSTMKSSIDDSNQIREPSDSEHCPSDVLSKADTVQAGNNTTLRSDPKKSVACLREFKSKCTKTKKMKAHSC
jgi:hypothetical protein